MHGHTGGHIGGGGHIPPSHHQHPGHQPAVPRHDTAGAPRDNTGSKNWLTRPGRDPRVTGAVLVVLLALVILLLVTLI